MNAETQQNVLNRLHFGLAPEGNLFLGHATLLSHSDRFTPVSLKHRIFGKAVGSHNGTDRYGNAGLLRDRQVDVAFDQDRVDGAANSSELACRTLQPLRMTPDLLGLDPGTSSFLA